MHLLHQGGKHNTSCNEQTNALTDAEKKVAGCKVVFDTKI